MSRSIFFGLAFFIFSCQTKIENSNTISEEKTEEPPPPPLRIDTSKTLKEKTLLAYIPAAGLIRPDPKNGIPFDKLDYDKIIAYDYEGNEEEYFNVINEKGKFIPAIIKQQSLTQEQADRILSVLTRNSAYGGSTAACFRPHLALVFFKENKKINEIDICLDCNYLISDIEIPAVTHKKVNAGTEHEYAMTGFTDSGKAAIIDLCKELNFHYKQYE